jgi:hypothetical protein
MFAPTSVIIIVFKLHHSGVVLGGKEGYNTFVTICFMGEES